MEAEVIEEKRDPLLNRVEVKFRVKHNGATPSRKEVREKLTALRGADPKRCVVAGIYTSFGARESTVYFREYESTAHMLRIEPEHVLRRNFSEEELEELKKQAGEQK
ncbi:MAG: 30S ribosomal protein S24e [Euryarchaeota archaeon]|nr:30S ribosomal protein S24e [Euryarchaeota archaeon]